MVPYSLPADHEITDPFLRATINNQFYLQPDSPSHGKPGTLTEKKLLKVKILDFSNFNYAKKDRQLTKLPKELEKLTQLETLILHENRLTDVRGLEKLTKLGYLRLDNNQLTELPKGLEKLTQLTMLHLDENKLIDVKGLEKLTKLTKLRLNDNQLTNVKSLENLTKLKELNLEGNQLTNVKGLEKLAQLKYLGFAGNQLTDVKGLEKLTKLTLLRLSDNPDLTKTPIDQLQKALPKCRIRHNAKLTKEESVKVIEAAIQRADGKPTGELTKADLEKVTELDLRYNQLTDVKGLENLTQLTSLNLHNNKLTDVKGLEKLTQLDQLYLWDNPDLTKAQIDQLQKALPKCTINHNATK